MQKLYFPNIQKVCINNFSLYAQECVIIDFSKAVSCIMGANGIGKSTLLNCINYAITGYINQPDKKVRSIKEFVEGNNYHKKYFTGRINEIDKDTANITVFFSINGKEIEVNRNFFPSNTVNYFKINGKAAENYESSIVGFSKLKSYNQFVFIMLKVLTFDESRDCLFWNHTVLTPTLFVCMGSNVEDAGKADDLSRELQKYGSRIRNLQWDITKATARLNTLIEQKPVKNPEEKTAEDIASEKNEYELLEKELAETNNRQVTLTANRKMLSAQITELSLQKNELERKYRIVYEKLFATNSLTEKHPLIQKIVQEECPICGTKHHALPELFKNNLNNHICPLCYTKVDTNPINQNELFSSLERYDKDIADISSKLNGANRYLADTLDELDGINQKLITLINKKQELEKSISVVDDGKDSWDERIASIRNSIKDIENDKLAQMQKRDEVKVEYDLLCANLQKVYRDAQVSFLPKFKKLAFEFTGLNLDMTLNSVTDDGRMMFKFILEVDNTNRSDELELSESQRFFIDIALRMAMVNFVCEDIPECSILIDTPEGSLDIAYETNAGAMFSTYVNENHKLIVTANLNASGLIKTLASQTGKEKFLLINMLKWAKLSMVQNTHYELFDKAIASIENELR